MPVLQSITVAQISLLHGALAAFTHTPDTGGCTQSVCCSRYNSAGPRICIQLAQAVVGGYILVAPGQHRLCNVFRVD